MERVVTAAAAACAGLHQLMPISRCIREQQTIYNLRGHQLKLSKQRNRLNVRKFFTQRVVNDYRMPCLHQQWMLRPKTRSSEDWTNTGTIWAANKHCFSSSITSQVQVHESRQVRSYCTFTTAHHLTLNQAGVHNVTLQARRQTPQRRYYRIMR